MNNSLASLSHIDVIGVTETWLHGEPKDHEVSLPGYAHFRQDRPSCRRGGGGGGGGGVALCVKSNLRPQLMTPPLSLFAYELLNISEPTVLILACPSPKTPHNDTTNLLSTLAKLITHRSDCLFFGDFIKK